MCEDFLAARIRLATSAAIVVEPFDECGSAGRTCWHHVRRVVETLGGEFAYGWALASVGPAVQSGSQFLPLYSRWVNHVLWCDPNGSLWEVTPVRDEVTSAATWMPTTFVPDNEAHFEIASDENCCPRPSVYFALRPEGEWTADCLCQAERASREAQDYWVARALHAIRKAGLVPTNWRLKRAGDKLRDIWIMASSTLD